MFGISLGPLRAHAQPLGRLGRLGNLWNLIALHVRRLWCLERSQFLAQLGVRLLQRKHLLLQRVYPGNRPLKLRLSLMQLRGDRRRISCGIWRTAARLRHTTRNGRDNARANDDGNSRFHNISLGLAADHVRPQILRHMPIFIILV